MTRSPFNLTVAYRYAFRGALLAVAALMLLAASAGHRQRHDFATVAPAVPVKAAAATCTVPTPTTAAGYTAMFDQIPTSQWGAADVSISVRVGAYNVWLFGDTIGNVTSWSPYKGGFVHSTAITQRYGCLHVSQGGSQLLPSQVDLSNYTDPASAVPIEAWFWIKSAAALDSTHFLITADHVQRTGPGVWDFKVVGQQTAHATVLSTGDVVFDGWVSHAPVPVQHIVQKDGAYPPWSSTVSEISNGKVLASGLPHTTANFSYAPFIHSGTVHLASGKALLTVCTNSTPLISYAGYRPLWVEVTL